MRRIIDTTPDLPYRKPTMTNRLDVRLDAEHRRRLEEVA